MARRAVLLCCLVTVPATAGGLYKWQDQHGAVHYSDHRPAQEQAAGVSRLNPQGVLLEAGESPAQQAARLAATAQQKQQQGLRREQQRQDRLLRERYDSVRDIERQRDAELQRLQPGLLQLQRQQQHERQHLASLQAEANRLQQAGKPLQGLPSQIAVQQRLLDGTSAQLQLRSGEIDALRRKAEQDSQRLRQLLGTSAP
ncbi:DUF4124 domain-containing protein [Vogesella indigofera]|uniref:DUF4124 domain-containing protein n=1 Tax=Vogesella indigofera TaxID=45465 RepID=UPI00234F1C42|nr:DUF4124 domain-containing protein [Vogesella indigofera]MDC7708069.1 DUF4124 domain-containing protein [Vogesella indigofera]